MQFLLEVQRLMAFMDGYSMRAFASIENLVFCWSSSQSMDLSHPGTNDSCPSNVALILFV